MPPLTRAARPLLNIVRGKPHATEEDHEITTRSPKFSKPSVITNGKLPKRNKADDFAPRQGEDKTGIYDSPESSADELNSPAYVPPPGPSIRPPRIVSKAAVVGDSRSKADAVTNVSRIVDDEKSKKQEYGSPKRSPPAKIPPWMVASPNKKRRKKPSIVYTTTSQKAKLKLPAYTEKPALVEIKPAILFKRPNSSINVASSRSNSEASEIVFVRPTINNESHLNTEVFEADDLPSHTSPLSSPEPLLSSPPSSTVEENLLEGKDFPDHEFCTICGSQVSRAFRIAWEDENCQGGRMTLKKQELFCQTHTRAKAKEAWAERRYPTVNWTALPDRLRRYRASVAEVLRGNHRSTFQDAWEELVRTTESRTIQKVWQSDLVSKTWSGYYGSKGSRIMLGYYLEKNELALLIDV